MKLLATVRIFKVAELLDTTSQEVLALLKRDHGIELKSASSSIEEVVARSFVERVARTRNISLPQGDMFGASTAAAKGGKKTSASKKPEPPKAAPAPILGPPRLVRTVKPAAPVEEEPVAVAEPIAEPVDIQPEPLAVEPAEDALAPVAEMPEAAPIAVASIEPPAVAEEVEPVAVS